jgi:hypothetical protein
VYLRGFVPLESDVLSIAMCVSLMELHNDLIFHLHCVIKVPSESKQYAVKGYKGVEVKLRACLASVLVGPVWPTSLVCSSRCDKEEKLGIVCVAHSPRADFR